MKVILLLTIVTLSSSYPIDELGIVESDLDNIDPVWPFDSNLVKIPSSDSVPAPDSTVPLEQKSWRVNEQGGSGGGDQQDDEVDDDEVDEGEAMSKSLKSPFSKPAKPNSNIVSKEVKTVLAKNVVSSTSSTTTTTTHKPIVVVVKPSIRPGSVSFKNMTASPIVNYTTTPTPTPTVSTTFIALATNDTTTTITPSLETGALNFTLESQYEGSSTGRISTTTTTTTTQTTPSSTTAEPIILLIQGLDQDQDQDGEDDDYDDVEVAQAKAEYYKAIENAIKSHEAVYKNLDNDNSTNVNVTSTQPTLEHGALNFTDVTTTLAPAPTFADGGAPTGLLLPVVPSLVDNINDDGDVVEVVAAPEIGSGSGVDVQVIVQDDEDEVARAKAEYMKAVQDALALNNNGGPETGTSNDIPVISDNIPGNDMDFDVDVEAAKTAYYQAVQKALIAQEAAAIGKIVSDTITKVANAASNNDPGGSDVSSIVLRQDNGEEDDTNGNGKTTNATLRRGMYSTQNGMMHFHIHFWVKGRGGGDLDGFARPGLQLPVPVPSRPSNNRPRRYCHNYFNENLGVWKRHCRKAPNLLRSPTSPSLTGNGMKSFEMMGKSRPTPNMNIFDKEQKFYGKDGFISNPKRRIRVQYQDQPQGQGYMDM